MEKSRLLAAVIGQDEGDIPAALMLLGYRLNRKIDYIHYKLALELDSSRYYDFIIVNSLDTLRKTIERFAHFDQATPPIIHLFFNAHPVKYDYKRLFPYHEIVGIRQAPLDKMDETLQIEMFEKIVAQLAAHT